MGKEAIHGSVADIALQLSDAKRELLERRLRGKRNASVPEEIPPRPPGENPMSFGQERLWFQSQVTDNPALFNIAFLAHIDGPLDVVELEASVNEIVSRHEILRAGFRNNEGSPSQFFATVAHLRISRVDFASAPEKALGQVRAHAQQEARAPFDLASPPLMRVTLFKLAPSRHALLFVVHHLVWDGWSSGVFIEEIANLYEARRAGGESTLSPLTMQYADFAHWHRMLMASEIGERQIEYWRDRLAGLPELISLPTDRPRRTRQTHEGGLHEWKMTAETLDRISAFARRRNVTQFAVLLAAYSVLLMHYTGQKDIAVGTTIAYRTRPALEKLVGFFANALVMRMALEDDPTFETLVERTQRMSIDAQSHQDAPFDMLVERLAPKRGLSHNPLFQVAFVQHNLPIEELRIGDLRINFENLDTGSATFDLVLHIYSEAPGLKVVFEYDAHILEARTIHAMSTHFDVLVESLLAAPGAPVSQARLLDARQEEQAIACSGPALADGIAGCLLQNVLDAAPAEAIAVVCGNERLTYGELSSRSNRLAHHLRALGVGPEMPVAMLIEPSVDTIVALFGILKADGAYLPLDPSYPVERIRSIVQDCGATTLVTNSAHAKEFAHSGVELVLLDRDADMLSAYPSNAPAPRACEDNLAYVIYTSGSTGLSKGVMISHRNAVASTRARQQFYREKVRAFLLLSSVSFDSSVAGIFWTIAQEGTLRIATEGERRDPSALAALFAATEISHLLCLPSLHAALLDVVDARNVASLRCCIVAGETCPAELAKKHFAKLPNATLVNEYGPTECTVWSTAHEVPASGSRGSVPIGRPIPGAQAALIGVGGALAPQGASGELYIGGVGLARGYVGRPDLTAERFTPNPFGAPGERLYRTGDRARHNPDGDIEFLGRLDEQLKIRGFRVDPREIETIMLQRPDVVECVVVAKTNANGVLRLVAYHQSSEVEGETAALKQHASQRLPSFMVPDMYVKVDRMPRLPNGKIDRSKLLELPASNPVAPAAESGDASLVEGLIADIWREVLGVGEVCGSDNFFDLGGNSLAAIQVVARMQQLFGREISVGALFESADLSAFAAALEGGLGADFEREIAAALSELETEAVI